MNLFWFALRLLSRKTPTSKGAPRPDDYTTERRTDANDKLLRQDDATVMAAIRKFLEVVQ